MDWLDAWDPVDDFMVGANVVTAKVDGTATILYGHSLSVDDPHDWYKVHFFEGSSPFFRGIFDWSPRPSALATSASSGVD